MAIGPLRGPGDLDQLAKKTLLFRPHSQYHPPLMPEATAQRLHDIFATIAARFPEHVAIEIPPGHVRTERCSWTYARLLERSSEFRDALLASLRPDAVASILLPRESPDLYAAQLGVLMAGGAFSCLDPRFPDEHLRSVLAETDAEVLITDATGAGRLEALGIGVRRLLLTADVAPGDPAGREAAARNSIESEPRHLAYVIYTSGTTGRPKGVMIEHRSIVNLVLYDVAEFGLGPDDRVAQCSSPAYDSSIDETWLAFAVGATLVVLDDETVRLGPDLVPWLRRERITAFCPPPTLLRATGCADPESELPDLRFLYVGGEALQPIATATTVRVKNGKTLSTDGPFAETREQLGGYYILECDTLDEALEAAKECPGALYGTVELRPIMELPGAPT